MGFKANFNWIGPQVSYIIVDDADTEMEVIDPFAEAGIEVPPELPYKSDKQGYKS